MYQNNHRPDNMETSQETKFLQACLFGDIAAVSKYIETVNIDTLTDKEQRNTGLHLAIYRGHLKVANYLIKNGAALELQNNDGETPLMIASRHGHLEMVSKLLDAGVNIDTQDKRGLTSLMHAALRNNKDIVELLLNEGADKNIQDNNGNTAAIHTIRACKDTDSILFLYKNGADFLIKNNNGFTALDILKNSHGIPDEFKASIEKMILDGLIDQDDNNVMGL